MPKQLQTPPTDNVDALFQVQVQENQLLQFVNIWLYKHYHKHLSSETLWYVNLNMHLKNHAASTDQQMIIITFSFFIGSSLHSDNIKSISSAHPMQKSG